MGTTVTYEYDNELESLLLDRGMDEKIRKIISRALSKAARNTSSGISNILTNDPRQSYKAVKRIVYKRILGGNLSILNKKRRGQSSSGSRKGRTEQINSYRGEDRGFILRFVNSGTGERETKEGHRRGAIEARNFFIDAASAAMAKALDEICQEIDKEYNKKNG